MKKREATRFSASLFVCLTLISAGSGLSGCESAAVAAASNTVGDVFTDVTDTIFQRGDVNLSEKNYAAADYLVQQIKTYVPRTSPISVQPLTLVGEPAITSELGRKIPEEVGTRLAQLGYTIVLGDNMVGSVQGVAPRQRKASFVLGGTYDLERRKVPINLRMVRASTGQVVGSFDYILPRSGDLKTLAEPKAKIFKISE